MISGEVRTSPHLPPKSGHDSEMTLNHNMHVAGLNFPEMALKITVKRNSCLRQFWQLVSTAFFKLL